MQEAIPGLVIRVLRAGRTYLLFACIECGRTGQTTSRGARVPQYCSRACANSRKDHPVRPSRSVERPCENCGRPVEAAPVHVRRGIRRFCSRACWSAHRLASGALCVCHRCGASFISASPRGKWCGKCEGLFTRDSQIRRARQGMSIPEVAERADYAMIIARDPCSYCGNPTEHSDHIEPVSLGGDDRWTNIAPSCGRCNVSKHSRRLLAFLLMHPLGSR